MIVQIDYEDGIVEIGEVERMVFGHEMVLVTWRGGEKHNIYSKATLIHQIDGVTSRLLYEKGDFDKEEEEK